MVKCMDINEPSSKEQLRRLIVVLLSAVGCAFFVTGGALYLYSPSGQYVVEDALLSPEIAPTLSYNDTNVKTGSDSRFIFNGIQFLYPDEKEQKRIDVSLRTYERFYEIIRHDKSLLNPEPAVLNLFQGEMASLLIYVRTESHAEWQDETKLFESVNFSHEGNHYRIKLHEEKTPLEWVYFYHPDIYKKVLSIVTQPQ